jgi:hypothetical protein
LLKSDTYCEGRKDRQAIFRMIGNSEVIADC